MIELEHKKVIQNYDVCVVGGGIAGVCAAISAARNGAKVALIQDRPVLGGNASSEIRMWICGAPGYENKETGIVEELQLTNLFLNPTQNYHLWDHALYSKVIEEPFLDLYLNTTVIKTFAHDHQITHLEAWQLTSQTWYEFQASLFIDCSGDSILRFCGAEFRKGKESKDQHNESIAPEESNSNTMGNSILLQCKEVDEHVHYQKPEWAYEFNDSDFNNRVVKVTKTNNFWWIEYGGKQDTICDAETIRMELIKIALGVWAYMKNHPDGRCKNWEIAWVGALPGKRENIRYVGPHILNQNDLEQNRHFADRIGHGGWPMDDHPSDGFYNRIKPTTYHKTPNRYELPYRCLYSVNIKNLFFAGRNISATHMALSSTRVMGTCGVLGQAAGTAAAMCIQKNILPEEITHKHIQELQATLADQDQLIPNYQRELSNALKTAAFNLTPEEAAVITNGIDREEGDQTNSIEIPLEKPINISWRKKQSLKEIRFIFDSNLKDKKHIPCWHLKELEVKHVYEFMPKEIVVNYLDANSKWRHLATIENNYKRYLKIPISIDTLAIQITFKKSWGRETVKVFSIEPN